MAMCDTTSPLGQSDLRSDVPVWQRHHVAICVTTSPFGQVDLWLDVPLEKSCAHM